VHKEVGSKMSYEDQGSDVNGYGKQIKELQELIKRLHTYVRDINEVKRENFHPTPISPEKLIEFMKSVANNAKTEIEEKYGNPWETWK
jgi:hypothetical protein